MVLKLNHLINYPVCHVKRGCYFTFRQYIDCLPWYFGSRHRMSTIVQPQTNSIQCLGHVSVMGHVTGRPLLWCYPGTLLSLQWRYNMHDSVWNHQPDDCLFNRLFRRRSKKTSKLRVTGLCAGPVNSPYKCPLTRKMFPFDDVIMMQTHLSIFHLPVPDL